MGFELRGAWGVKVSETIEAIKDQWKSMTSMAVMFVTTIFLGVSIQPVWNFSEARAFGEEGTTLTSNINFELMLISTPLHESCYCINNITIYRTIYATF